MSSPVVQRLLVRIGHGRLGPVRLALVLALASVPIVTWAILNPIQTVDARASRVALPEAFEMALIGVVAAAIAGGFVGGRLAHRQTLSILVTVAVAWFIGVASLSVSSSILGIDYESSTLCIGACNSFVDSGNPVSGAFAWGIGMGMSLSMVVPLVIALVLIIVSRGLSARGDRATAAILIVAGHAIAQFMIFVGGGVPAIVSYACLGIGVTIWASVIVDGPVSAAPVMEPVVAAAT